MSELTVQTLHAIIDDPGEDFHNREMIDKFDAAQIVVVNKDNDDVYEITGVEIKLDEKGVMTLRLEV